MKILIVDDEELTRTGVISAVDWDALGIHKVFQADDGLKGLELAKKESPDIILSDVRMPRMDGIAMLEQISKFLPNTTFIFMSGYSDKEYLKAAIKLKAVDYIEKPINKIEMEATLKEAVDLQSHNLLTQRANASHSRETGFRLVQLLTKSDTHNQAEIDLLLKELSLPESEIKECQTYLIQFDHSLQSDSPLLENIGQSLKTFFKTQPVHIFYELRHQQYLLVLFLTPVPLSEHSINQIHSSLHNLLASENSRYYITVGAPHNTRPDSHLSYEDAVILMQHCYFFPEGTILCSNSLSPHTSDMAFPSENDFSAILDKGTREQALELLENLHHSFFKNCSSLPNLVRDLYYRFFNSIEKARTQHQLLSPQGRESVLSIIEQCFSYSELHKTLFDQTDLYFQDLSERSNENSTIQLIKNYIGENYMKDTLSVKEISNHVFLSTSYVCTFFKNETGKTLNQFLTEYRMEKAKQLLDDPRYRISEISSKVGYNDGNYFGKSFKKYTGISPSEYRERDN